MTTGERLGQLLAELGEACDAVATVVQEADGVTWAIELEDDMVIALEWNEELDRLALSTVLESPSADRRQDVLENLLIFNVLWHGASGARGALDGPGGAPLLIGEIPASAADGAVLQTAIEDLSAQARLWNQAIAAGCEAPPVEDMPPSFGAAMRV